MGSGPGPEGRPGMTSEEELRCCVYLLASRRHGTLYLGITNDLVRRVHEHKCHGAPGFTVQPTRLLVRRQSRNGGGDWKIRLIEEQNPEWRGLYANLSK